MQPLSSQVYGLYTGARLPHADLRRPVSPTACSASAGWSSSAASFMAIGHLLMAFEHRCSCSRCCVLILGNGAFKPNISTQVGGLYAPGDPRRDARSRSSTSASTSARSWRPRLRHARRGVGWHYGFAAAGVGMMIGLAIYSMPRRTLPSDELPRTRAANVERTPLDATNGGQSSRRCPVSAGRRCSGATYEQQATRSRLWADADFTDRTLDLVLAAVEIPANSSSRSIRS